MRLEHPSTLASVGAYRNQPARRTFIAAVFVALYALTGSFVWQSLGDPYRAALVERARIDAQVKANATAAAARLGTADSDGWVEPVNAPTKAVAAAVGKGDADKAAGEKPVKAKAKATAASYDPFDDEQMFEDDEASATGPSAEGAAKAKAAQEAVTPAKSALEFYTETSAARLKLAIPGASEAEVASAAAAEWQGMRGGERTKWDELAKADKARHDRERKAALRLASPGAAGDQAKVRLLFLFSFFSILHITQLTRNTQHPHTYTTILTYESTLGLPSRPVY